MDVNADEENIAWVPPGGAPQSRAQPRIVRLLNALAKYADAAVARDDRRARLWRGQAAAVLADDALAVIGQMIESGEIPLPGSPGWERFLALAVAGEVEVGFALIVRGQVHSPALPGSTPLAV